MCISMNIVRGCEGVELMPCGLITRDALVTYQRIPGKNLISR